MKTNDLTPVVHTRRPNAIPAFVLSGVLILTGCQKKDSATAMNEAGNPPIEMEDPSATEAPVTDSTIAEAVRETAPAESGAQVNAQPEKVTSVDETELRAALDANGEDSATRFKLARRYLDTERSAEALKLVGSLEGNAEAMRLAGRAWHQQGLSEEALEAYRKALVLNDSDAWSMNNMALIHIEREHFEEALPPLARAIELRPDVAAFRNNLGVALERGGHYSAAAEAYAAATHLNGSYDRAGVSRQRVLNLANTGQPAPNLADLADQFETSIGAWRSSEMAGRTDERK